MDARDEALAVVEVAGAGLAGLRTTLEDHRIMIATRHGDCTARAGDLGTGLLLTVDAGSNAVRGDEAPWKLVDWRPIAGNPVFTGTGATTWDRKIRERGYILVGEDGTYHLWYTGYDRDRPATMSLGHATSPDGIHWTRDPDNPIFTGSWVEDMCVVKRDGTYEMFAEGKNDIAHRLTSTDGLHWTDHGSLDIRKTDGTPIGPGPYGTPDGLVRERDWYLFYERGDQGVWLATSRDLKVWTNVQGRPGHSPGARALRRGRRGPEPGGQARRASTTPSTTPTPTGPGRTGPSQCRPLTRPGALGEIPGQPDHQEQLLEPDPGRPRPRATGSTRCTRT